MKKMFLTFSIIGLGFVALAFSTPPLVYQPRLSAVDIADVQLHVPTMQKQLDAMSLVRRRIMVDHLLVSKDPRVQYALVLLDLASIRDRRFHWRDCCPQHPVPPTVPASVYCPATRWDFVCIWNNFWIC